jgi:hypothetical protein
VDAANWITAVSTLGLFVAAVAAGIIAWRTFKAQKEQEQRAQAVKIGAWTATRGVQEQGTFGLCLLNDSSLPVSGVTVRVGDDTYPAVTQYYHVLPPGFFFARSMSPVVGTVRYFDRPEPVEGARPELRPTMVSGESWRVEWFSFVDATGQRWRRKLRAGRGEAPLVRIADPPSARDEENV